MIDIDRGGSCLFCMHECWLQTPPEKKTHATTQCGWCGAINEQPPPASTGGAPPDAAAAPPRPRGAAARLLRALGGPLRWLVVALVVVLIGGVAAVGIGVVIPRAFPSPAGQLVNTAFAAGLLAITVGFVGQQTVVGSWLVCG